jgi:hypothetical protein
LEEKSSIIELLVGCPRYIEKPIKPETFMAEIEKLYDEGEWGGEGEKW